MKLAVAYYRMSTDKQEASIPAQREAVQKYAADNGYQIIREYIDEGISGDATEKRHQFRWMIADAEAAGGFEAILCWDMDRFGRFDSIEAGRWVYPLRTNHVRLATVAQGEIDWTDFAGRMMYGIQTEAKHQYLTDLSRNVTRGMTRLAEQGKWPGGLPPIGYVVKDKLLEKGSADGRGAGPPVVSRIPAGQVTAQPGSRFERRRGAVAQGQTVDRQRHCRRVEESCLRWATLFGIAVAYQSTSGRWPARNRIRNRNGSCLNITTPR